MIRVILLGGLGNQMFQYAAAKSLAKRLNKNVCIDLYGLNKRSKAEYRNYGLDVFDAKLQVVSPSIKSMFFAKARDFILRHKSVFNKLGFFGNEMAIEYLEKFDNLKGNQILCGYFQNLRYFENIERDLRNDFQFKRALQGENLLLAKAIEEAEESVSIHIRRGDYLSENISQTYISCGEAYYKSAVNEILKKISNPSFFIFSDDMNWVKENIDFRGGKCYYVEGNKGGDAYVDMQLQSLCKHNVIANSTFSWWGAWLNNNPNKVVLAPSKWYTDEKKNVLLDEFYPADWKRIELE